MKQSRTISEDCLKYPNEWVALSPDLQRVVGHGIKPDAATKQAEDAGESNSVLLFILEKWPDVLVL